MTQTNLPFNPLAALPMGNERGASLLETSLIIGILLSVVFFIVEYSQIMFTRNTLEETVHQVGRKVAVVPNLDVDYRRISASDPRYRRAVASRRMAVEKGETILRNIFGSHYQDGKRPVFLNKLTQRFPTIDGEGQTIESPIAILLAGECATTETGTAICNTKPFGGDDSDNFKPTKAHLAVMASEFPIRVVVDVELPSTFSLFPTQKFQIQTYVYRQSIPQGPFSQEIETALGNPAPESPGSKEPPEFAAPAMKDEEEPDWSNCISQTTGQPMTESEMAMELVKCSIEQATDGGPCYFESCRTFPK